MKPDCLTIVVVGWHSHDVMFDEIGADLAKAGHRIVRYQHRETFAAKPDALADADILLCVGNCPVSRAQIEAAPRLRAIVSAVTGTDGYDMAAVNERGIVVANAQTDENIIGMAEATVLMILAALYDLGDAQDRLRRSLPRPEPLRARQLRDKNLGFIGLGKIGRETARLLAPWGALMQYSARRDADLAGLPPMRRLGLDDLLRSSDIVVVLASLNSETRGLLSADKLRLMKKTAVLVNMARGGIVDEPALIAALKDGTIARAALDVFAVEPLPADSPLRALPNVVLTPHMIGHTFEAHHSLEVATRENLARVMSGRPPLYVVNPEVLPVWAKKWDL
ncbi:MAG: hydroxyacid dehydrogenase [Xanthobacteraceae bacterium]|nr:hydroxyacid dehydrogenase [Xanthobacteraceae bacterium]